MLSLFIHATELISRPESLALTEPRLVASEAVEAPVDWAAYGPLRSAALQGAGVPTGIGGKQLLAFGGSISSVEVDGEDTMNLILQAAFGYFLDDTHEVGGQVLHYVSDSDSFEFTSRQIAPYYNYNYRQSPRLWYYGGAHAGIAIFEIDVKGGGDYDETGFAFGPHVGARYWLSPTTAVFAEPRITWSFLEDTETTLEVLFGFTTTL
ncbi:MAG: outer membrane beta-barrel protein [Planctomycetes bacterium]|nr:outer membrane beta-barrel protein [Planctomycetota bacterium]